jgi:hypothetical protein
MTSQPEHRHPELEELLARIERKLDTLLERDVERMQWESLRARFDALERQRREREEQ